MQENNINVQNNSKNEIISIKLGKVNKKEKEKYYIDNIKRLIEESGIDKNILKDLLFPPNEQKQNKNKGKDINNKDNKIKEEKTVNKNMNVNVNDFNKINKDIIKNMNHIQQSNSLKEWYQKINLMPEELYNNTNSNNNINNNYELSLDEELNWSEDNNKINNKVIESDSGVITFNGSNNKNNNNSFPHYIYLKNSFSFDISSKSKIYSWKIKFLTTSNLLGVGLAYKNIVIKNNNKFLNEENDNNFSNGIFALIQTYNPLNKKHCIRPWNCQDKNLVNHVAEFPTFKKGKIISVKYDSNKERIEFKMKRSVHIMGGVKLNHSNDINDSNSMDNNKIMTPCVVFCQTGDQVIFFDFFCNDGNIDINEEGEDDE